MPHEQTIPHLERYRCIDISLEPNEEILYIVCKHWIILLQTWWLLAILIILAIVTLFVGGMAQIPVIFSVTTACGILMIGLQYIFTDWLNNELDILIITTRRIIQYEQISLLQRTIVQASIDQIQEVHAITSGFFGNLLRYGWLNIKTAGDASDFMLDKIPKPLETSRIVHGFIDKYRYKLRPNLENHH